MKGPDRALQLWSPITKMETLGNRGHIFGCYFVLLWVFLFFFFNRFYVLGDSIVLLIKGMFQRDLC